MARVATETAKQKVADIMTRKVTTLDRNDSLEVANDLMGLARIRHLPVVEDGRVLGVVSERDVLRSALASALGYGEKARKTLLRSVLVKEVMSEPAVTIAPSADLDEAIHTMLDRKIGCLPVVADGVLVGLLSESDVLASVLRA